MATSIREFDTELYFEHLEEASFLYEQRLAYLEDPVLAWTALDDFEARFEAHIDALVVGGAAVLDTCRRRAAEGDFGELHAALRVLCRLGQREAVYSTLAKLDLDDRSTLRAAGDALKAECPVEWLDDIARIVARHSRLAPALAPALGRRRASAGPALLECLDTAQPECVEAVLWALARVDAAQSLQAAEKLVRADDPLVSAAALRAALRLGHHESARYALLAVQTRPWLAPALALAGDASAVEVLIDLVGGKRVTDGMLIGLGLLGDLKAVRSLYDCLVLPERAQAAAWALQLMTGAELYEDVFVPDEVDPDELFDDERERYATTGEPPKRADGVAFGRTVNQIAVDQTVWKDWLSQNKSRFDPERRYRCGEPYSPRALARSLAAERVPNRIRDLICDELRVRYGVDFPMETDMTVAEQRRLLVRLAEWARENESRFELGAWYFHGRRLGQTPS